MDVFILGFAAHPPSPRIFDKRLEELVFDTSAEALREAGVERQAIDHVTLATCDELDGRSISSMLLAAPAGGYLKDELKVTDSGMIGLCLAAMRIATGRFQLGLLASWSKTSIAPFEDVMRMRCEPFFTRPIGLNASVADALFAQALVSRGAASEAKADAAAATLSKRAADNPRGVGRRALDEEQIAASPYVSLPLRQAHQAPRTDGAVSIVLCSGAWLAAHPTARPLARIGGIGWAVDNYQLGAARLSELRSFRKAWTSAMSQAGKRTSDLDVIELDSQTAFHHLGYAAALDAVGSPSISPSGGPFAQNPYFCAGLIHFVEGVRQVNGRAGPAQVNKAKVAAAHGQHGLAQQGNAVVVIEQV